MEHETTLNHECPACGKTAVSCWVAFDWNKINKNVKILTK